MSPLVNVSIAKYLVHISLEGTYVYTVVVVVRCA